MMRETAHFLTGIRTRWCLTELSYARKNSQNSCGHYEKIVWRNKEMPTLEQLDTPYGATACARIWCG